MTTDSVPDPQISKVDGRVLISLDKAEADALLSWLDDTNTTRLNDHQYLYFIKFKRFLSTMNNVTSNVVITPVAEESSRSEIESNEALDKLKNKLQCEAVYSKLGTPYRCIKNADHVNLEHAKGYRHEALKDDNHPVFWYDLEQVNPLWMR